MWTGIDPELFKRFSQELRNLADERFKVFLEGKNEPDMSDFVGESLVRIAYSAPCPKPTLSDAEIDGNE